MAITARKTSGTGPINPMPEGIIPAVIVGVRELGVITGQFGSRYTVAVEFADAEGNKASRLYNGNAETKELSLHEKSNLRADLKALFGEVPDEIGDLEKLLLGKQATVFVEQYTKGEYTNAKVTKVAKPAKGQNIAPKGSKKADRTEINDSDIPNFA